MQAMIVPMIRTPSTCCPRGMTNCDDSWACGVRVGAVGGLSSSLFSRDDQWCTRDGAATRCSMPACSPYMTGDAIRVVQTRASPNSVRFVSQSSVLRAHTVKRVPLSVSDQRFTVAHGKSSLCSAVLSIELPVSHSVPGWTHHHAWGYTQRTLNMFATSRELTSLHSEPPEDTALCDPWEPDNKHVLFSTDIKRTNRIHELRRALSVCERVVCIPPGTFLLLDIYMSGKNSIHTQTRNYSVFCEAQQGRSRNLLNYYGLPAWMGILALKLSLFFVEFCY